MTDIRITDAAVIAAIKDVENHINEMRYKTSKSIIDSLKMVSEISRQCVEGGAHFPIRPNKRLEHMTEVEIGYHLVNQLRFIKKSQSEDTVGSMLIIFQEDMITQYGATIDPETSPKALRELADRIERRESIKRTPA